MLDTHPPLYSMQRNTPREEGLPGCHATSPGPDTLRVWTSPGQAAACRVCAPRQVPGTVRYDPSGVQASGTPGLCLNKPKLPKSLSGSLNLGLCNSWPMPFPLGPKVWLCEKHAIWGQHTLFCDVVMS